MLLILYGIYTCLYRKYTFLVNANSRTGANVLMFYQELDCRTAAAAFDEDVRQLLRTTSQKNSGVPE